MPKPDQTEQQPGADRFWGQFSQSTAGRSRIDEDTGEDRNVQSEPGSGEDAHNESCLEWCPICRSAELFRNTVSPELKQQAESIQHEAFGVLKAFLDAYADRTAGSPGADAGPGPAQDDPAEPESPRVTDIPLD